MWSSVRRVELDRPWANVLGWRALAVILLVSYSFRPRLDQLAVEPGKVGYLMYAWACTSYLAVARCLMHYAFEQVRGGRLEPCVDRTLWTVLCCAPAPCVSSRAIFHVRDLVLAG